MSIEVLGEAVGAWLHILIIPHRNDIALLGVHRLPRNRVPRHPNYRADYESKRVMGLRVPAKTWLGELG